MQSFAARLAVLALSATAALPALAGTVTFRSAQFSADKPVPHLHFEGEVVVGDLDRIAAAVGRYVDCDAATLPDTGGNCAVLTWTSAGGNQSEGLRIAQFLRRHAIATWVETGSYCHSACAFAFLGGSGHSPAPSIGAYVDRTIEPGATLGFYAPDVAAEDPGSPVARHGAAEGSGGNRDGMAPLIEELAGWNVDDRLLARIASLGADDTYVAATAQDLYLLRTALPDAPRAMWAPDPAEALRNACLRLLAHHENLWPHEVRDRLSGPFAQDLGTDDRGWRLSGFRLTDTPGALTVSYCATHTSDAHLDANADIALFYGPNVEGLMRPALTFFHRPEGWSMMATGGSAARRIFQRGSIGHVFLPPEADLAALSALP